MSLGNREKSKRSRKRKQRIVNYRVDHFRLGSGRDRERDGDSPPIFNALSGMWEATGESNLWPGQSGSNIPRKAASGSIATALAGHINSQLYVVLRVQ